MKCKLNYQFPQEIFIGYCYIEKFCSSQKFSLKNKIWVIFKKILEFVSDLFWSKISWYCNLLGSGGYINRKLLTNIRQSEFPEFYYGYISYVLTKKKPSSDKGSFFCIEEEMISTFQPLKLKSKIESILCLTKE